MCNPVKSAHVNHIALYIYLFYFLCYNENICYSKWIAVYMRCSVLPSQRCSSPPSNNIRNLFWLHELSVRKLLRWQPAWCVVLVRGIHNVPEPLLPLWSSNRPLHWRHNDHDGVSKHQPRGCLLNRLFRRRSKKTSKLRVTGLCVGNSPWPVNSPHKGPVTRKCFHLMTSSC